MTTYNFSALKNLTGGQSFNPITDLLLFDNLNFLANDLIVSRTADDLGIVLSYAPTSFSALNAGLAGSVTLIGMSLESVTGRNGLVNVRFLNGGALIVGDDTTGATNDNLNNSLVGTDFNDMLLGLGGNDMISGGAGNDRLLGGAGDDFLDGGAGNDTVDGGSDGQFGDAVNYSSADSGVTVNLVLGTATGGSGLDTLINIEHINGSAFNDSLTGDANTNWFRPGQGDDTVVGGAGRDVVMYEDSAAGVVVNLITGAASGTSIGADQLTSIENVHGSQFGDQIQLGNDSAYVFGRAGNDLLTGGTGNDSFMPGSGNDTIDGGAGFDWVVYNDNGYDNAGNSTHGITVNLASGTATDNWGNSDTLVNIEAVVGSAFNDQLTGNAQANHLDGQGGNDTLLGGEGNDNLNGGDANDSLLGGAGDDYLDGGAGNDTVDGGSNGQYGDTVNYSSADSGVTVNLVLGTATGGSGSDTLLNIEQINGSAFNDSLTGDAGNNNLQGQGGNDSLLGGAGDDYLDGGAGNDTVDGGSDGQYGDTVNYSSADSGVTVNLVLGTATGGSGSDTLLNIEHINGSAFNDSLTGDVNTNGFRPGQGDDTVVGGAGRDSVMYEDSAAGVVVNLITGVASGTAIGADQLSSIENVHGSQFGDQIQLGNGDGYVFGRAANDLLTGGTGKDSFMPGSGNDTIDGGAGFDSVSYNDDGYDSAGNSTHGVTVNLASGTATDSWGNSDTLVNIEAVNGSAFNDQLTGNAQANNLDGQGGNDTLLGGDGNDTLLGGYGNDSLLGGTGGDWLVGGSGNDALDGGIFADRNNPFSSDANWVNYGSSTAAVNVNLSGITGIGNSGSGTATDGLGGTDTLINLSNVWGSAYNDTLTGSSALLEEHFVGGTGDDRIDGGAITDTLNGLNANRVMYKNSATGAVNVNLATGAATGADGNDTLININQIAGSNYSDTLTGSNRTDVTERFEGAGGNDTIDGAGGLDLVNYANDATAGVNVNLATGVATSLGADAGAGTDRLLNIEGVRGSNYADRLTGGNAANDALEFFQGMGGNDTIDGGSGYDRVEYNLTMAGVNVTLGGLANGTATGDASVGVDTLIGIEAVRGWAFNDTLTGSNDAGIFESFDGREGNDIINGMGGIDRVDYNNATAGVVVNLTTGNASDGYGGTDTLSNVENVLGSRDFNDSLTGNALANHLDGQGGNDTLVGGAGNDTLTGGSGSDVLQGDGGNDSFIYSAASDSTAAAIDTIVDLQAGDVIKFNGMTGVALASGNYAYATSVAVTVSAIAANAGIANQALFFSDASDGYLYVKGAGTGVSFNGTLIKLAGKTTAPTIDQLVGVSSANTINGTSGNDSLTGTSGDDVINGYAGNDTLKGVAGNDTMVGGDGSDTYYVDNAGDIVTETNATASSGGIDVVQSSLAAYTLSANVENGRIRLATAANLTGNGLDNILYAGTGNNVLDGGAGIDTVSYAYGVTGTTGVTIDLRLATAQATGGSGSDTLKSIEKLIGSANNDSLIGSAARNRLDGGAGNDSLNGYTGADTMVGGDGSDTYYVDNVGDIVTETNGTASTGGIDLVSSSLAAYTLTANVENGRVRLATAANLTGNTLSNVLYAGAGNNVLDGVSGADTVSYVYATAAVSVSLAIGAAQATGGSGSDTLKNIDKLTGSNFHDTLIGDANANTLDGLALNDALSGGGGNDTLIGGLGKDSLTGGAGNDTFTFKAIGETTASSTTCDVITDFVRGQDKIDLSAIDANTATASVNDAFTAFIASTAAFTAAGQLRLTGNVLYGNTDTDSAAEFAIVMTGITALAITDLNL